MSDTPDMTLSNIMDAAALGLDKVDELCHYHIGLNAEELKRSRRLAEIGFLTLENGPDGPVVTRTAKGTRMLRKQLSN